MKKSFIALFCVLLLSNIVYAEGSAQIAEDNKAVISVQKQPAMEEQTQKQKITRNIACIIIQFNGKSENPVKDKSAK